MKIILVMAISLDGKIAHGAVESSLAWTSKEDTKFFVAKTKEIGTVIMGYRTFKTIGRPLAGRRIIVMTRPGSPVPEPLGEAVATTGTVEFSTLSPQSLAAQLAAEGVPAVVLAGGATVNGQFLSAGLIDEMFLTVEPVVFGAGLDLFAGPAYPERFALAKITPLSDNVVNLHYIKIPSPRQV